MPIPGVHVGKRRGRSPINVSVPVADEAQRPMRTSSKAPDRMVAWGGSQPLSRSRWMCVRVDEAA